MKRRLLFVAFFLLACSVGHSQTSWFSQSVSCPTIGGIFGIYLADSLRGLMVGSSGVFRTTNGGSTWVCQTVGGSTGLWGLHFHDSDHGTIVGYNGVIFQTTDGGDSWVQRSSGTTALLLDVYFVDALMGVVVGDSGIILRTTDGGSEWTRVSTGTASRLWSVSFGDSVHGVAVGMQGTVLATTDGGGTWDLISSGINDWLFDVCIPAPNTWMIVGFNVRLLRTTDGGASWTLEKSTSTTTAEVYRGIYSVGVNTQFVVGSEGMILKTSDQGNTWTRQMSHTTNGLYCLYFLDDKVGSVAGELSTVMHTISGGVLTEVWVDPLVTVPAFPDLCQNYPNPFNPITTISYTLPAQSHVTLKVFNVLGQAVATLVNGIESPGNKTVRFDAGGLPSGVYFYRLQAGSYSGTKMLMIVR